VSLVRTIALALLAPLLLAGCSAGEQRASLDDATPKATKTVRLPKSYRFDPVAITVHVGDTVTWKNDDDFTHDVTFEDGGPDTKHHQLEPGDRVRLTFDEAGTFDYVCTMHPRDMRGRVVVTA
jgi:plastocyanin